MASGSFRKFVSKGKDIMHEEIIFLTPMLITSSLYVNPTLWKLILILLSLFFEPTSTNLIESQSQNIPAHIEISNDGGDDDTQETQKI